MIKMRGGGRRAVGRMGRTRPFFAIVRGGGPLTHGRFAGLEVQG